MPLFASFSATGEKVIEQFTDLAFYAYANLIPQLKEDESKLTKVRTSHLKTIREAAHNRAAFKNSNFRHYKEEDLPKSLDEIYELYLSQPITEFDKERYLDSFRLPLYKTGLTIKELKDLYPEAMAKPLSLLMLSKKIQFINTSISNICLNVRFSHICKDETFKNDLREARKKYAKMLEEVEIEIATSWVEAIEKQPELAANPNISRLNQMGYTDLHLRNLKAYKHLLSGGKKRTVYKKRKNTIRRTRKRN